MEKIGSIVTSDLRMYSVGDQRFVGLFDGRSAQKEVMMDVRECQILSLGNNTAHIKIEGVKQVIEVPLDYLGAKKRHCSKAVPYDYQAQDFIYE